MKNLVGGGGQQLFLVLWYFNILRPGLKVFDPISLIAVGCAIAFSLSGFNKICLR